MSQEVQNLGMEKLKTIIKFKMDFGMAVDKALANGKLELADTGLFFGVLMGIKDVMDAGSMGLKHLKQLDAAEAQELKDFVKAHLDLRDEDLEGFINDAFSMAMDIHQFVMIVRNFLQMRKS